MLIKVFKPALRALSPLFYTPMFPMAIAILYKTRPLRRIAL